MVQFHFQEWTNSSPSMHSIGGGKNKPYVLAKTKKGLIHKKKIENKERH